VLARLIKQPPTKEAIADERKELRIIAVHEGKEPPQHVLLPEEMEQQSEDGRSSDMESAADLQEKRVNFSPPTSQPQKDGEGGPHNQLLGKRSHSRISSEKDAQHFVEDQSNIKHQQAWQEWHEASCAADIAVAARDAKWQAFLAGFSTPCNLKKPKLNEQQ